MIRMLKVEQLYKTYVRAKEFNALDDVNLDIKSGEFVAIVGKSGSGKSTLLNIISGILSPTSGKVSLDNKEISSLSDDEKSFIRNDLMGFVPQSTVVLSTLNILDNICLPFYLSKREGDSVGRGKYLLKELGLEHLESSYPRELSGGELRRVTIARALMNYPKIILADEPTSDLDVENTKEVLEIMKDINKKNNTTIVLVTHDLACLSYADKVYTMISGKISEGKNI
ncbi:ABC transporter ATP-binding protein [Parvimonas sp. D2]|uniref:ABC transporter ATP-binding protein n=1 Tax=unclassified Parvimonas TaxID=1151464 RepID=UPI002B47F25F|nr:MULTISPECIES: ABC transporter ATP-binding protein [unclassified Parvimonas]MEB3011525.1 ABC transporter ATP-binding protein [Parvimonas sp. D2]MEB3087017.1 ABC transporter ATP-binding protein [Parvimonas sp. D4]